MELRGFGEFFFSLNLFTQKKMYAKDGHHATMTPPIVYLSPVVRHRACVSAIAIVILETDLLNEGGGDLTENQRTVPTHELSYTKYDRYTGYITYIKQGCPAGGSFSTWITVLLELFEISVPIVDCNTFAFYYSSFQYFHTLLVTAT